MGHTLVAELVVMYIYDDDDLGFRVQQDDAYLNGWDLGL